MENKQINKADLLFNKPIEFERGIFIKIPTVEEVAYDKNFNSYTKLFTTTTREMFGSLRNVDELEEEYPTIMDMVKDKSTDKVLGQFFGVNYPGSAFIMEALHYWTGLEIDGDKGFRLLTNGKIIHLGTEWIIDSEMFDRFSKAIQQIICYVPDTSLTPPKPIKNDNQYKAWIGLLKGRINNMKRRGSTIADKILILSISMGSYIPPEEIKKMSIFTFNKLFEGLSRKEAYELNMAMITSGQFKTDKLDKKHWKETFKI